ncbi:MAG TPA: methyltransferase domain-containing protein [Opitutaceae bacterium]|nr:methyltransferase domain-containing protein [Opitutaceae bacterium]
MSTAEKSTVAEIRARFDADVERFSNLETGQVATMDAALCLDLVTSAAAAATTPIRRVLDVGCGAGNYSLKLREHGAAANAKFTLVDLSEPMLVRAKERLGPSAEATHQCDVRELVLADGSFDVILAAAVLHHLRTPDEWLRVFTSFHRWLRPGGSFWVFDLVVHEDARVNELMWQRYREYLVGNGGDAYAEKVFAYIEREDTPTSLTFQLNLAAKCGFTRTDVLHKNGPFAAYGAIK